MRLVTAAVMMLSALLAGSLPGRVAGQTVGGAKREQGTAGTHTLLGRRYTLGEKLKYHMKGNNRGRIDTRMYEVEADAVVKKDDGGKFVEEWAWSNLVVDGKAAELSAAAKDFRQTLSLDPGSTPSVPNLSQVIPLIGPITDALTFYSDLWLANRVNKLRRAGDHFYFERGTPNSWADGTYAVLGEDSIDFDLTLTQVDEANHIATLVARHVPPANPQIKLPAEWMRAPVADTPNNWMEVVKSSEGKYSAEVGKETFDVQLKVSLADGRIVSATWTIQSRCWRATAQMWDLRAVESRHDMKFDDRLRSGW